MKLLEIITSHDREQSGSLIKEKLAIHSMTRSAVYSPVFQVELGRTQVVLLSPLVANGYSYHTTDYLLKLSSSNPLSGTSTLTAV